MKTEEMIKVMQAYERGEQIECRPIVMRSFADWTAMTVEPDWNWTEFDYRVKPKPKYRPYNDAKEFLTAQKEHGMYIKTGVPNSLLYELPIRVCNEHISTTIIGVNDVFNVYIITYERLLDEHVWQDGTPCGVKEE